MGQLGESTIKANTFGLIRKRVWVDPADFEMVKTEDWDTDLSWIGEFSDTPGEYAVKHVSGERHAYKWFNAATEYADQDYAYMMQIHRGEIMFYGVKAQVKILIPFPGFRGHGDHFIRETFESPGLWGIGSDSGEDYFEEVFSDESHTLSTMLSKMGVQVGEPNSLKFPRIIRESVSNAVSRVVGFFTGRNAQVMREIAEYTD